MSVRYKSPKQSVFLKLPCDCINPIMDKTIGRNMRPHFVRHQTPVQTIYECTCCGKKHATQRAY